MDVSLAAKGDHLRAGLKGRLDEAGSEALRRRLASVKMAPYKTLSFDCRDLEYISSAGIGLLMRFHWSMSQGGGTVRLENLPPQIRDLFRTLKLDQVMTIGQAT